MEPLIIESDIGASVKTTHSQLLSYNCLYRGCIYPYIGTTKNGEYFIINMPYPIYCKLIKGTPSLPTNSIEDINLLKYLINKLYH